MSILDKNTHSHKYKHIHSHRHSTTNSLTHSDKYTHRLRLKHLFDGKPPLPPIFLPGFMCPVASNHRQARTRALTYTALTSLTMLSLTTHPKTYTTILLANKDSKSKHSNKTPQSLSGKQTREGN